MKRIVAIAIALLVLVCSLAACGGSDEKKAPATFVGTTKDVDLAGVMKMINEKYDLGESRELNDSERYYGISTPDLKQFFAQKPVSDREFNEIVICEAATPEAVSRIEKKLNDPLDDAFKQAKSYSKEDLAVVEQCKVVTNGKYVYLVISPHAAEICALIESQIN